METPNTPIAVFTANDFTAERLMVSFLVHRISSLPKESLRDLSTVALELSQCSDRETLDEISETMREILFPELVGKIQVGMSATPTKQLASRSAWIGGKIKEYRKTLGMSQEALAEKSGLPQSHISRLECGQHSPGHKTLEKIASALGIKVCDLDPT